MRGGVESVGLMNDSSDILTSRTNLHSFARPSLKSRVTLVEALSSGGDRL